MTLNDSWGYHHGDSNWKSVKDIIKMLAAAASGNGNLLLNIGPDGAGRIPEESIKIMKRLGEWMKVNREAVFNTDNFSFDLRERGDKRGDWSNHGIFTASGNNLYLLATNWTGPRYVLAGLETKVKSVSIPGDPRQYRFEHADNLLKISGLPEDAPDRDCSVIRIECAAPPVIYHTGGMRIPLVPHPRYDPCPSDIKQ